MKRKTIHRRFLFAVSAALMLLVAACNDKNKPQDKELNGSEAKVTFRLSLPQGEAFTYRSAIHDEPEWTVKSLTCYTFSKDGGKLMAIDPINKNELIPTGEAEYSWIKEFNLSNLGVYRFIFVANDDVQGAIVGTTSQVDFERLLMSKILPEGGTSKDLLTGDASNPTIPMTGIAEQGEGNIEIAVTGTTGPVSVVLTRVVARIDVSNHIPNLTITQLSFKNAWDRTSVFPDKYDDGSLSFLAPPSAQHVTMSAGFADLTTPLTGVAGEDGACLKKAFYLYEGSDQQAYYPELRVVQVPEDEDIANVVVKGILKSGQEVEFMIPLKNDNVGGQLIIKRNFLYRLTIGDNTPLEKGHKVVFTIEETPWNSVILNHEMQIIEIFPLEEESPNCHWDASHRTFYTNSSGKYKFQYTTRLSDPNLSFLLSLYESNDYPYEIDQDGDIFTITVPDLKMQQITTDKISFIITAHDMSNSRDVKRCVFTIIYDENYQNPAFK